MEKLRTYLAGSPETKDGEWAAMFGISRSHFNMIRNGRAQPGKAVMTRIASATGGAVPVTAWFE